MFRKLLSCIFFILVSFSSDSFGYHPNAELIAEFKKKIPDTAYKCQVDDDCIITSGPCGYPIVLNKKSSGVQFESPQESKKVIINCIDFVGPRWPLKAICMKSVCEGKWD